MSEAAATGEVEVLLVDDEANIRNTLSTFLTHRGYKVHTADGAEAALRTLEQHSFHIALLDLRMPGMDGIELAHRLLANHPGLVILILTGHSTVETAVQAMRVGVYDYLTKPVEPSALLAKLEQAKKQLRLEPRAPGAKPDPPGDAALVGRSPAIRRVGQLVTASAPGEQPVLVYGETGTGKELVARAIHGAGPRARGPFVGLSCSAIPEALIESELFGHVRGAFTGAMRARPGRMASASGGTLFLDELSAAPLALQAKLLRVLQERKFAPVGSDREEKLEARVIAAVNEEPRSAVAGGRLREDLFYRIGMFRIDLPPLRERLEDVPLLVEALLKRATTGSGRLTPRIAPELMASFYSYAWPGNVRELENLLLTMVTLQPGDRLTAAGLPADYAHLAHVEEQPADGAKPLAAAVEAFERLFVTEALRRNGGRVAQTANELGLDERSLRRKLRRLGIDRRTITGTEGS